MKDKKLIGVILISIVLLICAVICVGCDKIKNVNSKNFAVVCLGNEYAMVIGDAHKEVEYGKEVEFTIRVQEGYKCISSEGIVYNKNGEYIIKIQKVTAPISISIATEKLEIYDIVVKLEEYLYKLEIPEYKNIEGNRVYEGDKIRIKAINNDEIPFFCWSTGGTIENGGTIISHYNDAVFTVNSDLLIYANYIDLEQNAKYINYRLNGGNIENSDTIAFFNEAKSQFHLRYNTDIGIDAVKEGYTLVGWNTAEDGTGERIGLGSRVTVSGKMLTLYAMWEKWTDSALFECQIKDYEISISKCLSQEDQIVIPSSIGGYVVVKISAGAFSNLNNLHTIVFPNTIKIVEEGAFSDCSSLTNMVFSDNIEEITDNAFFNTSPKYLFVNAVRKPTNVQIFGYKILDCIDRVLLSDKPNLLVQGGSSSAYGFDSEYFEELLDGEYNITNFGWNAYRPMAFLMGISAHICKEDDVYVHVGEIDFAQQYATDTTFQSCLWGLSEGNYDVISWVDISIMTKVFDMFTEYNKERDNLPIKTYDEGGYYDSRGDILGYRSNTDDEVLPEKYFQLENSVFSESGFTIMNGYYLRMQAKGVRVYESFGTINKDVVLNDDESLIELDNILRSNLVCPVISKLSDYLFDSR
ncbi:hypothetical protein EOM82_04320, partial [bacterium]|nr:hypothetical protein [bacterium]